MTKTRKIGTLFLLSILFTFTTFYLKGIAIASGTTVPLPSDYKFVYNGKTQASGFVLDMKTNSTILTVSAGNEWNPATDVTWSTSNSGIVSITTDPINKNRVVLQRNRPGYATITASISYAGANFDIICSVKVNLEFDKTNLKEVQTTEKRILILDNIGDEKTLILKYVNEKEDDPITPIGAQYVTWESSNEGVVTVDPTGKVKAIGSGSAEITVTTNTLSNDDKPMSESVRVVVAPRFSFTYDVSEGVTRTCSSGPDFRSPTYIYNNVPSNFTINSDAALATNLTWVIYECVNGTDKLITNSSKKMTYDVSDISGNVTFSNIKSGTYKIFAFTHKDYNEKTSVPYAYMKIIVPIDLGNRNIVMNVGDTYNLIENSNITGLGIFVNNPVYIGPDDSTTTDDDNDVAIFNDSNYVITARMKGKVTIRLMYDPNSGLFDEMPNPYFDITVTVIDGISLSTTRANIYTNGSIMLNAIVSDTTQPITWSSSDDKIAKVENGLVTGLKAGSVTITAKQVVNGITKRAVCQITVQQSVSKIEVDPAEIVMPAESYKTLHATITPNNLSGINLIWRSSNEDVVTVEEFSGLTATIKAGKTGGTAVISAINQDNVVVGYCHVTVQQTVTSIVLSETEAVVDLSMKRLQLRATVYPETAINKEIKWSTTDPTKATVDNNGLVTLLKPGTVTIIATSDDNAKATAYCNLMIQIPVSTIALDETVKTMFVGQSARLSYLILPANASNNIVSWTSTNPSVVSVDATGKVSAKSVGTAVIILKSSDGGHSVYCTITVKNIATGVKLDKTELKLKAGEYYYLKASLTPKDSTENNLVWESSDTKVAVVDGDGKVTGKQAGNTIIMVRTEAGAVAYCKVTVTQPVSGLILNFTEKTIFKGEDFKLQVSVSPTSATKLEVTWKSSNTNVATVTADGEVAGLIGGTAIITCTTVDGGYSASCVVTVKETVTKISLDFDSYRLGLGKSFKLTATVTTETATDQKVTWVSSNDEVATVNQNGKVTGIALGYATITAIAKDGSEVEASCDVRVVRPVESVTLNKTTMSMFVGEGKTLKATINPKNATYKNAKWTSSDPSIAIVDEDGMVIGLKVGSVTITAEALDNSGKKAICYVWVNERVPSTGITLQDKKLTMVPGESKIVQLVLIPATSTDSYSWSSDNVAVASVDKKSGRITAKSTGTAYITVMTDSGKTATVEVTVIGLNMTSITLEQYTDYPYPLVVEGATSAVKWTIDNPQVAVVSNGYISTRGTGTTMISAIVNGRKLTCKLTVVKIK